MPNEWTVKQGNSSIQEVLITDKKGAVVQNLADTTEIKFQVKKAKADSSVLIEKTKGDGIEVNQPSTGYLRITLNPADTEIAVGKYVMGLQLKWSADEIYEIDLTIDGRETEGFKVVQDVV